MATKRSQKDRVESARGARRREKSPPERRAQAPPGLGPARREAKSRASRGRRKATPAESVPSASPAMPRTPPAEEPQRIQSPANRPVGTLFTAFQPLETMMRTATAMTQAAVSSTFGAMIGAAQGAVAGSLAGLRQRRQDR